MSEQEPEAEDGLGKDVEDSIGDDLSINARDTGTVSNTPDATLCQLWSWNCM